MRCAPPANKPTPEERDTCAPWLARELALLRRRLRVVVVLGGFGWQALWPALAAAGCERAARRARRSATARRSAAGPAAAVTLLGCYHVSQQNTFTGRLTEPMLDAVLARAAELASSEPDAPVAQSAEARPLKRVTVSARARPGAHPRRGHASRLGTRRAELALDRTAWGGPS